MDNFSRPKTLVCYICGREYGTSSLAIHIKQCQQKFITEEAKKPKALRKPLPQPPQLLGSKQSDIEQYNENAFNVYKQECLCKCYNCGRTFNQEAFDKHQKICSPDKPFKVLPGYIPDQKQIQQQQSQLGKQSGYPAHSQETQSTPARPRTLMCYICGREYGTKSLGIHIPQCKEKFHNEERKKLPQERRKPPTTPPGLLELLQKDNIISEDIQAYNRGAFNKYNKEALEQCQNCGRTFTTDALAHHSKACTVDKPFKQLDQVEEGEEVQLAPCRKCGRKYLPTRLEKHESSCKEVKPQGNKTKPQKIIQPEVIKEQVQNPTNKKIEENSEKQLQLQAKCYKCGAMQTVSLLKSHTQHCKQNNPKPELYEDIVQLKNPTPYIIELYNSQVNIQPASQFEQEPAQKQDKQTKSYRTQFKPDLGEKNEFVEDQLQQSLKQSTINQNSNEFDNEDEQEDQNDNVEVESQSLVKCEQCSRKFASDRIAKHKKVCKGATYYEKVEIKAPVQQLVKTKWREKHQEFISILKYNKEVTKIEAQGGDISKAGPPPVSLNSDYVQCPYCFRKFDPSKSEKHIAICSNVINKPKGVGNKQSIGQLIPNNAKIDASPQFKIRTPQVPAKQNQQQGNQTTGSIFKPSSTQQGFGGNQQRKLNNSEQLMPLKSQIKGKKVQQ